ncbi:MAG: T9SS type A sorting domain-containing protein, partial [Bacteroidetes bacterium]|nr:T9SS type A sorting domain-containing protein [Bacteroidota bacterium]
NSPLVIANQFSLYPNPASSELVIENVLGSAYEYAVTDMAGSVVERGTAQGIKTRLNVAQLASGIYNIRIFDTKTKQACTLRFLRP